MSLSTAALAVLVEKGLTAADILEVALANDVRRDPTATERKRRQRERDKSQRDVTCDTPLIDRDHIPPVPQTAKAVSSPFAEKVVSSWNDGPAKAGAKPSRGKLNSQRQAHLRARVKENGEDAVLQAIRNVAGSKFHCGENERGWKMSLGWMLQSPENFEKCLELAPPAAAAPSGKRWTAEERAEHLAKLERMGLSETPPQPPPDDPQRQRTGPRPIGQLVHRIRDQAA